MNEPVSEISQDKSSKSSGQDTKICALPEGKPLSHTAAGGAIGVGGIVGALTTNHFLRQYTYENLDKQGAFDRLKPIFKIADPANAVDDVLSEAPEFDTASLRSVSTQRAGYRKACEAVMHEHGLSNWSQRWQKLSGNQKAKTVVFAAGAAVATGAVVYNGLDRLLNHDRDPTPAR